jgi:hypothetical protein
VVENCTIHVIFDKGTAYYNSVLQFINCDSPSWSGFTKTDVNSRLTVKVGVSFKVTYAGVGYPVKGADVELATLDGNKVYQQVTGDDGTSPVRLITIFEHLNGRPHKVYNPFDATATLGFNYDEKEEIKLGPNHLIEMSFTDDTAPELNVQVPTQNSFYQDPEVQFKGRLSDLHSGIARFFYTVDGGENKSLPVEDPWAVMVVLPEGELTLVFTAVDILGNEVNVTRTITIDMTPPVPTDLDPPLGTLTRKYQLLLNGTTEPGATLTVQGNDWEVGPDGSFSGHITLGDEQGEQTVDLTLTDAAGNEGTFQYTVIVDRIKPELTVDTTPDHRDFPFLNESRVRVFGETEPNATIKVHINSEEVAEVMADDLGSWSVDIDLVLGENDLLVDAWDVAGNRKSFEIIDFFYDTTPTEITLLVPVDGDVFKYKETTIYVKVRTEPDAVIWVNDEEEKVQPGHGEVEFPEVDLPNEGNNTITVYSRDKAGNLATMSIVVVREEKKDGTENNTDGFPVWLLIVALAIVAVVAIVAQRMMSGRR